MKLGLAVLPFGLGFGFVLGWARLADPDVIEAMLRLRDFEVFLVMGSAIATATLGTRILRARRARSWIDGAPIAWKTLPPGRHHLIGSALFGLGWSLSNACPGPIAVQLGRGEWSALFTAAGFMSGIALRDRIAARAAAGPHASRGPIDAPAIESAMCGEGAT